MTTSSTAPRTSSSDTGDMQPSLAHLNHHLRDLDTYKTQVQTTAEQRLGPAWWGIWEQHISIAPDATLIDLGTGPGTMLKGMRARYPEAKLIGVDLHPALLELARTAAEPINARIVAADLALPIPLPDQCADVVASSLVFHELPYPPDLLANAARLLKPGGMLVLFDIVKFPIADYMTGRELNKDALDHYRDHCLFSPQDLGWLVTQHGFTVQETVMRAGGRFAMIIARRDE